MAVITPAAWMQAGSYSAHTDRQVLSSLVRSPGVVQSGDLEVTQSDTPGMSVKVSAGKAWIEGTSVSGQGMYNFVNDATISNVTIGTAHSTLSRTDLVVARIEDATVEGVNNVASIQVIEGTAGSGTPAMPESSELLKTVTVPAGVTTITAANLSGSPAIASMYTQMSPSALPVTSSTRPTGDDLYPGLEIFETNTKRNWVWTGDEWAFRGGKGPRGFVTRNTPWTIFATSTSSYVSTLQTDPSIFETAYYTFVGSGSSSTGDRVRVKQDGLYSIELYANVSNFTTDFSMSLRAYIAVGSTGLVTGREHFPSLSTRYPQGRSTPFSTRTVFLTAGTEVAINYAGNGEPIAVDAIWMGLTLVG